MSDHKEVTNNEFDPSVAGDGSGSTETPTVKKDSDKVSSNGESKVDEERCGINSESKNGSTEPEVELTAEEMKEKLKNFNDVFEKMKGCVFRTDISAMEKVNQVC